MRAFIILLAMLFVCNVSAAKAQDNDRLQPTSPLSDLERAVQEVQKEPEKPKTPEQKTGIELSNEYFMRCVGEKRIQYTAELQELMCGCTAAKMPQYLSPSEIASLQNEDRLGTQSRAKFLINIYRPCMFEALPDIADNSCKNSDYLRKNVILGKRKVCGCMRERYRQTLEARVADIITNAVAHEPLTLDPLHYFLGTVEFERLESSTTMACYNAIVKTR